MKFGFKAFTSPLFAAVIGALLLLPGAALANGDVGEHVKTYWLHMDDYAKGVERMNKALDGLVQEARNGKFDVSDVEGLIAVWEDVDVHGAIEVVAMPLYGPVWEGIAALRTAAEKKSPVTVVAAAAKQTSIALHEGLGALKLAAFRHDNPETQAAAEEDPMRVIGDRLERALAEYKDGRAADAKKLIHDAYFNYFEGVEGALIEQDASLVSSLEEGFNGALPGLISKGAPVEELRKQIEAMTVKLTRAEELLTKVKAAKTKVF